MTFTFKNIESGKERMKWYHNESLFAIQNLNSIFILISCLYNKMYSHFSPYRQSTIRNSSLVKYNIVVLFRFGFEKKINVRIKPRLIDYFMKKLVVIKIL